MSNIPKIISTALEAPNIGTNKLFINVNGKTSKLETNQNAKIQYKLNNPFRLDIGDKVTLYQAFVNEGGLNSDTLTFQEDIESTIKFMYYMPSQLFANAKPPLIPGSSGGSFPSNGNFIGKHAIDSKGNPTDVETDKCLNFSDYQDMACFPCQSFLSQDPAHIKDVAYNGLEDYNSLFAELPVAMSDVIGGDIGTPYYLFENYTKQGNGFVERDSSNIGGTGEKSNAFIKPAYGEVTIKIPAGNYEASSLAKNITEQFNGAFILDTNNSNFLTDRLYNPNSDNYAGVNTANPFGDSQGGAATRVFHNRENGDSKAENNYNLAEIGYVDIEQGTIDLKAPSPIRSDLFLSPDGLELWERNTSNTLISGTLPLNCVNYARINVPLDGSKPVEPFNDGATMHEINTLYGPDAVETFDYQVVNDRYIQYMSNNLLLNINALPLEERLTSNVLTNIEVPNRYCGTHSFKVSYSDDKTNRFSISNLHESYKLPSITTSGDASTFGGQQATKYNAVNRIGNVSYPIDASMGIMVNNFGFDQVKETTMYKDLKKTMDDARATYGQGDRRFLIAEYNLNTKKFTDFFPTEAEAKTAWKNTLWSRLGFPYEQLGDLDKTVETVQTIKPFFNPGVNFQIPQERLDRWGLGKHKLKGIITHNDFDFSDIMSCANLGADPTQVNGHNVNVYDMITFQQDLQPDIDIIGTPTSNVGTQRPIFNLNTDNTFTIMATSQSIDADELPDLNAGNSYYLITSDIIKPNGLDANGDPMNLIGVMSKENSSNDTLYSVDGIPNIITEEKLVSELSIEIRNPDNTLVPDNIIGKASGFILMVEKAINSEKMETKTM